MAGNDHFRRLIVDYLIAGTSLCEDSVIKTEPVIGTSGRSAFTPIGAGREGTPI